MRPATRLARGARLAGDPFLATSPPIYQTATFAQESALGFGAYDYSRSGNPTRDALERELAALEGAKHALVYASGVAALAAAVRATAAPGGEVLAGDDLYGGSYRLLEKLLAEQGVRVRYVDGADLAAVAAAIGPATRLVLVETPTNPLLRVATSPGSRASRTPAARGSRSTTLSLTPYLQRPLELGADLVVHSATKALGGHGDLTAGVVATSDDALAERLAFARNAEGTALSPFESWLLARGLRTLAVRIERQETNARRVAELLAARPEVDEVRWPGLASIRATRCSACRRPASGRSSRSAPERSSAPGASSSRSRSFRSRSASAASARRRAFPAGCRTPRSRRRCAARAACRRTSCACRSGSRTLTTSSPISSARSTLSAFRSGRPR